MAYTSLAELKKKIDESTLIQLVDDEKLKPAFIDDDENDHADMVGRISDSITAADALIDAYCGAKYEVPFASAPQIVQEISAMLTIYNLYTRRSIREIPQVRIDQYEQAIDTLTKIGDGTISLGITPPPTDESGAATNVTTSPRVFTRTSMVGF